MTLQQIYYALKVTDTGSISKAAEGLFVSQPSLSNSILELESEIGFPIFERTNRGVKLTIDGRDFISEARKLYEDYLSLEAKVSNKAMNREKFGVSAQHYSFATKAFSDTVKKYDTETYEFAMREEKTSEVIRDVAEGRSEIGVLYRSSYNKDVIKRLLDEKNLEFHPVVKTSAFVYIWKNHPLAEKKSLSYDDLKDYTLISFEQEGSDSNFLAEEILSDIEFPKHIIVTDRNTSTNLMIGLLGYTLCSGIISSELNGSEFIAIPFMEDDEHKNQIMEIGYIIRRGSALNEIGNEYVKNLTSYFEQNNISTDK